MSEEKFKTLLKNLHNAEEKKDKELEITALIELGKYHYVNEEFEKAKLSFENALKLNKKAKEVNYYLALILLQNDNYSKASEHLEKELEINSNNKNAKEILEKLKINANIPLVTMFILILNSLVFYFTYPKISFVQTIKYTLNYDTINITNAITSLFFHANLLHFAVNMIILISFGIILEKHVGSLKFLAIYLVSGIVGNIMQTLLYHNSFVLGASAALFGLLGAIILINPLLELKIFGFVKAPIILVFGGFFAINSFIQNYFELSNLNFITGDFAHMMGFLCGVLIAGLFYHDNTNIFYNWLLIFAGFWMIEYGAQNIISYFNTIGLWFLVLQFILITSGILIIIISYILLKNKMLRQEPSEVKSE